MHERVTWGDTEAGFNLMALDLLGVLPYALARQYKWA